MSMLTALAGTAMFAEARADEVVAAGKVTREGGFVDIELPIVGGDKSNNGRVSFDARGLVEGLVVGFVLDLDPEWKGEALPGTDRSIGWGSGTLQRWGEDSDRFVTLLARLYALPEPSKPMLQKIRVTVVDFRADPPDEWRKFKLFFAPESEDGAEVFINIGHKSGTLQFNEKDVAYRQALLRALTVGA